MQVDAYLIGIVIKTFVHHLSLGVTCGSHQSRPLFGHLDGLPDCIDHEHAWRDTQLMGGVYNSPLAIVPCPDQAR